MKDLVGRKVKGFKFYHSFIGYDEEMNKYIGQVGVITDVDEFNLDVQVKFADGETWTYPLGKTTEHLVPEEMYNKFKGWFCGDFPINYEIGKEYEFTHKSMRGWDNRKLLAVLPTSYNDRFIVTSDLCSKGWTYMSEIREIKPKVKELTLEEAEQNLTQFLGIQIKIKK